jgi:ABC-2 type transport system permease protein
MKPFIRVLGAELSKQHKNAFTGKAVFFSLLLWPVIIFFTSWYAMKPFRVGGDSPLVRFIPDGNLPLFLLTGYLVFQLYWTVVQAAWTFERERKEGTLETVFLAPGSKLAFLIGRSLYSLGNGMWMFGAFAAMTFLFVAPIGAVKWGYLALALGVTLLSATVWGALLCAVSLFSRDSGYLYYIFQAPMELFGGVRIPLTALPAWGKWIALLFPVSYSLLTIRDAVSGTITDGWWLMLGILLALSIVLIPVVLFILAKAEAHARRSGSWTIF